MSFQWTAGTEWNVLSEFKLKKHLLDKVFHPEQAGAQHVQQVGQRQCVAYGIAIDTVR